ncbi:hypothetical protein GCM10012280_60860 [Wenjunlia tyrosinilytica]|uniref:Uncharacterized protein n=1 Tax=Wenjunlia tyrosinilytica TaxID=1544741 RepID=A0A917ZWK7_9ACTN|nr:hypothetical protein GCM10012280_60860 [Wenjunlia tyrosinilytica]
MTVTVVFGLADGVDLLLHAVSRLPANGAASAVNPAVRSKVRRLMLLSEFSTMFGMPLLDHGGPLAGTPMTGAKRKGLMRTG